MGRHQNQGSLRSKAAYFVSDVTTVLLNPISDKPSKPNHPPQPDDENEPNRSQLKSIAEEGSADSVDGPDTSSFTAFLYSLLSSAESGSNSNPDGKNEYQEAMGEVASNSITKESGRKKSLLARGKQSLGRALYQAARLGGYQNQASEYKGGSDMTKVVEDNEGIPMQTLNESAPLDNLPEMSEPSLLLTEKTRSTLYLALPVLVQGRKWVLLYSTWRHGISLATLYRRSMLCPGLSLLVVGDRKGAVFGGLVEAPLRPTNKRKYQVLLNNTFSGTN
ncbi:TLD-domain containing nucleolar protein [Actinidia rufa]|uniref:Oxidation resistance protein 1 n=1 Tax=Actinidia rufa TaxID=165716 RepID=A0A7J0EYV0_9ERIC|nr:TLD-domain containing nucleolar protein [Actinidia rufa]